MTELPGELSVASATKHDAEADVVELRPIENLRVCAECLVSNAADDEFCTACGAALQGTSVVPTEATQDAPLERAAPGVPLGESGEWTSSASKRDRRLSTFSQGSRWVVVTGVASIAAGLAGTAAFAVLWNNESGRADRLTTTLAATEADLSATEGRLKQTERQLDAATSLAERRRNLLVQTRGVLGRVDALLSSVDNIQGRARDIQDARYAFSNDADALIATLVTLANYLIDTESDYLSYYYLNTLIDEANGELDVVRSDQYRLSEQDSAYDTASRKFGTQADGFSKAVRDLQRQLKAAVDE